MSICSLHGYILSEQAVSLYPLRDQSGQSNSPLLYATGLQTTPPSSSLAPNWLSFFHLSRTRSSCCHIIPSPPSLYHLLNKQNRGGKKEISLYQAYPPAHVTTPPFCTPPPSLTTFYPAPVSITPKRSSLLQMWLCSLGKQGQKASVRCDKVFHSCSGDSA